MEATENVRVKFSNSGAKGKGVAKRFVSDRETAPLRYCFWVKPKYASAPATRTPQPTHPEWNARAADFHLPSKDDPQQMYYRHNEKQRGGDRHIGFSVQSACLSASRPRTPTVAYG
jgi:hypothetical protein